MKKKQIVTLCMLAAMTCQIFLSGKTARAASSYEDYQLCQKENNPNACYLRGRFTSTTNETFHAHFFVYINNSLYNYSHKIFNGARDHYVDSAVFGPNQPYYGHGYTTK